MLSLKPLLLIPLLFSILFSSACKQTSSSSADPEKEQEKDHQQLSEEVERISLTGLAIKGLVRSAAINIFALEDNGQFSTTPIGMGASDNEGEYQVRLALGVDEYSGPIKVVLSHLEGATIQCDDLLGCGNDVAAGDFYPLPTDFTLVAIAELNSGILSSSGDKVINLTALTTLASDFIESDTVTAAKIKQGNNQLRAVLSLPNEIDLTTTRARNIVNSASTGNDFYGAVNAAFQRIANTSGQSLGTILANYSQAFRSGQIVYRSNANANTFKTLIDATIDLGHLEGEDLAKAQQIKATVDTQPEDSETQVMPPDISLGENFNTQTSTSITLTATTLSGTPSLYSWEVISGEKVFSNIDNSPDNSITFTSPSIASEISIRVIAQDDAGTSDNDIITITVMEPINADTSLAGNYHGMLNQQGLDVGVNNGNWRELFADSEFSAQQNWSLSANTNGTGQVSLSSGTSQRKTFRAGLEIANMISNFQAELQSDNEPGGNFPFTQAASGSLIIKLPAEEFIEEQDQRAFVSAKRNFEMIKFAKDSYIGRNIEKESEYGVVNNEIQFNDLLSQRFSMTNLVFAKKSNISDFSSLVGNQFIGMEHTINIKQDAMSFEIVRFDLTFDDAQGNFTLSNEDSIQLAGLPNGGNTVANNNSAMTINTMTNPAESLSFNSISQGLITFSDNEGLFQLAINPNKDALVGIFNDWGNTDATTDFASNAIDYREAGIAVYFKRPSAAINLDGKVFAVQSQGHYYAIPEVPQGAEELPGRLHFNRGNGTISFSGSTATFKLTVRDFVHRYPNNDLSQSAQVLASTQTSSITFDLPAPLSTGPDGCFSFPSNPNTLFCTNGNSMIMREHGENNGNNALDKFLTLYTGALLP